MKHSWLLIIFLSLLLIPNAKAQYSGYIFGYGGSSLGSELNLDDNLLGNFDFDFADGQIYGVGLGSRTSLLGSSRFEIEYFRFSSEFESATMDGVDVTGLIDSQELSLSAFSVNFLKDIPIGRLSGYIGGGLGYGTVTATGVNEFDDGLLVYQGIAGIEFQITNNIVIFGQYKHIGFNPENSDDLSDLTVGAYTSNSISGGLRFAF